MNYSDEWIIAQWSEIRPSFKNASSALWALIEHMVDGEVAAGEYGGCTTDLELAWAGHESRVKRVLSAAGIEVS